MSSNETASTVKRIAIPSALVVGGVTVGSFVAPIGLASADETDIDATDGDVGSIESDGDGPSGRFGAGHGRHHGPRAEALEEILGLSAEEIRDALSDGASLADVAEGQGVSADELTDALVAAATEHIDEAVAEGRLDAAEAEERKAGLEDRIAEMIDRVPSENDGRHGGWGRGGPLHGGVEVLEEVLGLSSDEIQAGLDDGKTLADLAEEQGVAVDDVADALVAQATERIDEAVADGKIDEDRAEQAKERLEEMIDRAVEAEPFDLGRGIGRAEGRRFHHRHHAHHRDGHGAPTDGGETDDSGDTVDTSF